MPRQQIGAVHDLYSYARTEIELNGYARQDIELNSYARTEIELNSYAQTEKELNSYARTEIELTSYINIEDLAAQIGQVESTTDGRIIITKSGKKIRVFR